MAYDFYSFCNVWMQGNTIWPMTFTLSATFECTVTLYGLWLLLFLQRLNARWHYMAYDFYSFCNVWMQGNTIWPMTFTLSATFECTVTLYGLWLFEAVCTLILSHLTSHNWQKWKRVFLTRPCHKIYRDEAVGLKCCKYTWKIPIFVKMWNLRQYREIWYFVNNCLMKARI